MSAIRQQKCGTRQKPGGYGLFSSLFPAIFHSLDAPFPLNPHQVVSHHVQIGQGAGGKQPVGIFLQSTVTDFHEPKDALDHPNGVFHFRPDTGFGFVLPPLHRIDLALVAVTLVGKVPGMRGVTTNDFPLPPVGGVTPDPGFLPMQQIRQYLAVMHIGGGRHHRVNHLALAVHPHMGLHPEIPLVAFPGLVHVRITGLLLVLGGGRRIDDGGIHDRPRRDLHALALQMPMHLFKQPAPQIMLLQQMAETTDRGFIRYPFPTQVNAHKPAQGQRIVQRFFRRRIRQVEPLLDEVDAQHALHPYRPPAISRLGVNRFDQRHQFFPRHHLLHLRQKQLPARGFVKPVKRPCGKLVWRISFLSVMMFSFQRITDNIDDLCRDSLGPSLQQVCQRYSLDQIEKIIRFGKKGKEKGVSMPGGLVYDEDAALLARWLVLHEDNVDSGLPGAGS